MERAIWKCVCCFVLLLFLELCNGLPIGLHHTYGDGHTQFLTGLVAILLTICGIVCLAGCMCCQRKNGFKDKKEKEQEKNEQEFQNGVVVVSVESIDHGHVNPLASTRSNRNEFTIFNPLTKEIPLNVFAQNGVVVHREDDWVHEDIDVRAWFGNGDEEFPRSRLKYIREFGKGWFGRVVEGTALGMDPRDKGAWQTVVVRILEASASQRQRTLFLHDAAIYRCTPHPNILLLLGRSLDNVPLLLLQEYTSQGDLKAYLKQHLMNRETLLNREFPLQWCYQLTSALKHLHSANVVHTDLATRNCRLTETMDLKLGDYGCSTVDYPDDYYHGTENIPIRWCAPESVTCTATTIQTKNVTHVSNIWSLGVCFWEIYECGSQPYSDLTDDEVVSQVLGPPHMRPSKPKINVLYTDYMYRLMQSCWYSVELRPNINQVYSLIEDLVQIHKNTTNVQVDNIPDFDQRWDNFKPNCNPEVHDANSNGLDSNVDLSDNLYQLWTPNLFNDIQESPLSTSTAEAERKPAEFKLGPVDTIQRTSSESETEDENWRRNVECGLYTEKVRQKSRSVADLMILTHIDCSESDSETPLTSINYKHLRYAPPKPNLEALSLTFGSEGNLMSVQNTFEEELKRLQEERRDSLLFVPETPTRSVDSQKILENLNRPSGIEPENQIFSVYNVVTITPTISPVHAIELNRLINYNSDVQEATPLPDIVLNTLETKRHIPKLSEIIENNIELMDYIIAKYDPDDECVQIEVDAYGVAPTNHVPDNSQCEVSAVCVKADSSESDDYITALTHTATDSSEEVTDLSKSDRRAKHRSRIDTLLEENASFRNSEHSESLDDETDDYFTPMSQQNSDSADEITLSDRTYCVEKAEDCVPNDMSNTAQPDTVPMSSVETLYRTQIETLQNVLKEDSFIVTTPKCSSANDTITATQDFLNNEILTYEDFNGVFSNHSSTPFTLKTEDEAKETSDDREVQKSDLKYSLETWDNFLGKSFDEQHEFDDYSEEPISLLFTEVKHDVNNVEHHEENMCNEKGAFVVSDAYKTLPLEDPIHEATLDSGLESSQYIGDVDVEDIHLQIEDDTECYDNPGYWESENSGGWYLHPQANGDDLQGEMDVSQEDDSYVRFSMDDEVMAAIRNELMMKLPQAQKAACEQSEDMDGEYETTDRNEVFLRYNCFNAPLSPIPEESYSEYLNSGQSTPHCTINTDLGGSDSDSEWSEAGLGPVSLDEDTHSPRLMDSPHKGAQNRHTPSQDSCCSNDTLFNLEELQCNERQLQEMEEAKRKLAEDADFIRAIVGGVVDDALAQCDQFKYTANESELPMTPSESSLDVTVIKLEREEEVEHVETTSPKVVIEEHVDVVVSTVEPSEVVPNEIAGTIGFGLHHVAPLNSPEDRPWKHIEASLTDCPSLTEETENTASVIYDYIEIKPEIVQPSVRRYEEQMNLKNTLSCMQTENLYDCVEGEEAGDSYAMPTYENTDLDDECAYENVDDFSDHHDYENVNGKGSFDEDEDFCPLSDIRFSGPGDVQMMSTSFSESNDLGDEHDWDSGSDTRSSSSGEFIWKEGEHEASVKALQAAPQEEIPKAVAAIDGDETSSCSDEDCDGIEFVPSAWDKFATPTKSAMRSPERSGKTNRGVSFKKQKYHCVYEYPREPEPSVLQNYDLWKDPNYIDWDLDRKSDPYMPGTSDYHETASSSDLNLIQSQHINYDFTGSSTLDDDFYISSSAKPFDMLGAATSQFFPGKHCDWSDLIKNNDNVTPDSGVEDITPGSLSDSSDYVRPNRQVLPLKTLAQLAANKHVNVGANEIGGLRHTRNRLKLDLPPSPNAFTKSKSFSMDSPELAAVSRQVPTFTTFGKSRFQVQQVDTQSNTADTKRNVSFEALPYKPISKLIKDEVDGHAEKSRIEVVRGEASLLDSADEDSGIESCTLERKHVAEVTE